MSNSRKRSPRPPAKRPAAAPEVLHAVICKDGSFVEAWTNDAAAISFRDDCNRSQHTTGRPYRVVKYRLDTRR